MIILLFCAKVKRNSFTIAFSPANVIIVLQNSISIVWEFRVTNFNNWSVRLMLVLYNYYRNNSLHEFDI